MLKLNVYDLVYDRYEKIRIGNDDGWQYFMSQVIESLTPTQKEIFYKECDIIDELEKEHGFENVTAEMYEQAFIDAGLESVKQ